MSTINVIRDLLEKRMLSPEAREIEDLISKNKLAAANKAVEKFIKNIDKKEDEIMGKLSPIQEDIVTDMLKLGWKLYSYDDKSKNVFLFSPKTRANAYVTEKGEMVRMKKN